MINIDGLKNICIGTVNQIYSQQGLEVSESELQSLQNPDYWILEDQTESFITQELKLLMSNTNVFFQIEFIVVEVSSGPGISRINVIHDPTKQICYLKS